VQFDEAHALWIPTLFFDKTRPSHNVAADLNEVGQFEALHPITSQVAGFKTAVPFSYFFEV
jgi:hypothetical protein